MSKKVIVAGHICLDITPIFQTNSVQNLDTLLQPGKLVELDNVLVSTGGPVSNTGLAMKLLGADVSLMGKVGKDEFGDIVCNILKKYDADEGMIRVDGETTSYSVVVAVPGIDRMFLHCPGANNTYSIEDIDDNKLKEGALFHFGYPPLMKAVYKNNGDGLVAIFKKVKEYGLATSLDLAAVDPNSEAGKVDWGVILERTIPYVDFFAPSIEELCYMLDRPRYNNWQERANGKDVIEILNLEEDIKPLADKCMSLGAKVLLLKCGKLGFYYRTAQEDELKKIGNRVELNTMVWANKEGFEKSFKPKEVLSATGAGDTCIAAFLIAMINGETFEESIKLASAYGACVVEHRNSLDAVKDFDTMKKRIADGWEKND